MTATQLDEAAINVYAALRHLTLAQVASVAHMTVGDVVQHAFRMEFDTGDDGAVVLRDGGEPPKPRPSKPSSKRTSPQRSMAVENLDTLVYDAIASFGEWVAMGDIQSHPKMTEINAQRTRRAIKRLKDAGRVNAKGSQRTAVYTAVA